MLKVKFMKQFQQDLYIVFHKTFLPDIRNIGVWDMLCITRQMIIKTQMDVGSYIIDHYIDSYTLRMSLFISDGTHYD